MRSQHIVAQGKPVVVSKTSTDYDRQWWIVMAILLVADTLLIWLGLTLAYTIRIQWLDYSAPPAFNAANYNTLTLLGVPLFLLLFRMHGLYDRDNLLGGTVEYRMAARAVFDGIILMILTSFILRDSFTEISRGWLLASLIVLSAFILLGRFGLRVLFNQLRKKGWLMARVLIVGANDQGVAVANLWRQSVSHGMNVIGFLDDFKPIGTVVVGGIKVIGRPTALDQIAATAGAHEVVVVPSAIAWETYEEIISAAALPKNYTLRLSTGFYEMLANGVNVTNNTAMPLLTINEARLVGIDATLKRMLDVGLLVLAAPFAVLLAVLLALGLKAMGRKVLSRYLTIGERGQIFSMFKFNTPFANVDGSISRMDNAPLQARLQLSMLEYLLYRTGLDKLPQLWNVLRGQMSFVGPRPRVVGGSEIDPRTMPNLQAVKPGLIGPWSIAPTQAIAAPADELRDELTYVRQWTIWVDARLLVMTALNLLKISRYARPPMPHAVSTETRPSPAMAGYNEKQTGSNPAI